MLTILQKKYDKGVFHPRERQIIPIMLPRVAFPYLRGFTTCWTLITVILIPTVSTNEQPSTEESVIATTIHNSMLNGSLKAENKTNVVNSEYFSPSTLISTSNVDSGETRSIEIFSLDVNKSQSLLSESNTEHYHVTHSITADVKTSSIRPSKVPLRHVPYVRPEWGRQKKFVCVFVGMAVVIMGLVLCIVILWRKRSYHYKTRNTDHLRDFKHFSA